MLLALTGPPSVDPIPLSCGIVLILGKIEHFETGSTNIFNNYYILVLSGEAALYKTAKRFYLKVFICIMLRTCICACLPLMPHIFKGGATGGVPGGCSTSKTAAACMATASCSVFR